MPSEVPQSSASRRAPVHDRVERMVQAIRQYRESINQASVGSVELHFNESRVTAKLVQVLPVENPPQRA